jgi:DNA-3-methyladenine glycosylase I
VVYFDILDNMIKGSKPKKPSSYCSYVSRLPKDNLHRIYHDTAYGFPIDSDDELFERLILEINQAGLSWDTILKKQKNFQKAFDKFNIKKVAKYGAKERDRLLADAGIIRNRLKVDAVIHNAQVIVSLQKECGSFKKWIESHHPKTKDEWVKIFKKTFKFTGGEIVNEFLQSAGYLPSPHIPTCPIHKKIIRSKPMWMKK